MRLWLALVAVDQPHIQVSPCLELHEFELQLSWWSRASRMFSDLRNRYSTRLESAADYGGAEDFYRFLQEELLPIVAEAYQTDPADRTLYGHSWGGLFTLGVLFKHPEAFRNFVASSPSIWWNQRAVLTDFHAFRTKIATGVCAPRILISVGGTEQKVPTPLPAVVLEGVAKRAPYLPATVQRAIAHLVVWKMLRNYAMVTNAKALAARLKRLTGLRGYCAQVHVFDREDHLTALPASIGRATDFVLRP